jgi:Hint domain
MPLPCYRAGTRLRTPHGETAIENITPGDLLISADGKEVAVKWVGWRHITIAAEPERWSVLPIRIARDAIEPGVPRRDLFVSVNHSLLLDGILIPAYVLLNGTTITQEETDAITYYHVECDNHTVLLAEGAPAESYLDDGNRSSLSNGSGVVALHPNFAPKSYQERAVAPFAVSGELVEAVRRKLFARAQALGFSLTRDPDLAIIADGRLIRPDLISAELAVFAVPAGAQRVRITSRSFVPAETVPVSSDRRRLGVAIERFVFRGPDFRHVIEADYPDLRDGFHDVEGHGQDIMRWTDGAATLPYRPPSGSMRLELHLRFQPEYWLPPVDAREAVHA